ncbi:DedA family protein [Pseudomonas rhodesiae]|uniref:DedA family protein n=1 Tax=Pseudomonas rhodesiae TaxID=76760 RepID=UPI001473F7B0|nr:DedA family protein [Pseudomonas rhodesiae]NMZ16944.1 DedA family protein [Pseudomonas rhodesiae]
MFEHLDLNHLLTTYGYLAVFVGCLLEGETILILGGVAAHQQVLKLLPVIACASLAGMLGDQLLFWAGRYFGDRLLPRLHKKQAAIDKITTLIHRYPTVSIFSVRFLYGMRLLGPMVIGASRISPLKFACINAVGALVWATLFASAGYWAGEFLQRVLGDLKPYRLPIALGVVGVVVAVGLIRHYRSRRKQP